MIDAIYLLLVSCLLQFFYLSKGQQNFTYCDNSMNYSSRSAYQQNLHLTLTSLAANASLTGYYVSAEGQTSNVVYGLINCPRFVSKKDCQICANSAATEIIQLCPNRKAASVCNEKCSLQYSDSQFFSTADVVPRLSVFNGKNADGPTLFNSQLESLLGNISSNTAADPSRLAVGMTSYTSSVDIYGMAQCTRNLTVNECLLCLQSTISNISQHSSISVGARVYALSCNIRYEIYSFFSLSSLPPPPPPLPSPPPSVQPNSTPTATKDSTSNDGKSSKTVVIVVISGAFALAAMMAILCGCLFWRKGKRKRAGDLVRDSRQDDNQPFRSGVNKEGYSTIDSLSIGLNTLREATGNFCDAYKLGQGGSGPVYRGKLRNGREITVKRLSSSSGQGLEELKTEVMLAAKLLHRNLVRLLGFCLEEEEKLLVYEYLSNGSLDKVLFDQNKRLSVDWEKWHKIIIGIAKGLLYLHEDSQLRIIHRDLKASNILCDESMQPKISDFGLARPFFGKSNSRRYQSSCWNLNTYILFLAVDDMKVVTLHPSMLQGGTFQQNPMSTASVFWFWRLTQAWQHWTNGTVLELVDPALGDQWAEKQVLKCIHIGLLCVQDAVADRPTMSQIVRMLSGYTMTSPAPSRPAFYVSRENSGSEDSGSCQLPEPLQQSINEVSITELYPRL